MQARRGTVFLLASCLLLPVFAAAANVDVAVSAFTAESTYRKLARDFPFIQIASHALPPEVRSLRDITYVRYGERSLQLDLYLPAAPATPAGSTGSPALVLVHGGAWRSGARSNLAPMAIRLAQQGYVAATVSYRLSQEARYPAAVHDVKAAIRWLRSHAADYGVDAQRIAVAGGSAGGQIASLVGVSAGLEKFDPQARESAVSSAVQAIINIDGLSDFTSEAARLHEDDPAKNPSAAGAWFGGRYAEKTALWHEASPTFYVNRTTPPILFIGSAEPRFAVGREAMVEKLNANGIAHRVHLLPATPHAFWLFDPWLAPTIAAMTRFLNAQFAGPQRASVTPPPASAAPDRSAAAWQSDIGDGRYRNPVLHADYSDPDAIRVGDTFYMTASSFSDVPGLPLLSSKDLVNWTLVGHALPRLVPAEAFAAPQPGKGVWAPCLRFHAGKFWIFYPDPDHGVYVMSATQFAGPWSTPHLLLPGKGIIDPTPLWDEDGRAYLLHAWAKSRAGINNMLSLRQMAPDASRLLDETGKVIVDGNKLVGYRTLEGPKFYKSGGYYYIFAPAGGVEHGWQSVFRARRIDGPYEDKIVLAQGKTPINGPHQGAWVNAPDGRDWFLHFQDKGPYGRVVHLQPMRWQDGWPQIGEQQDAAGVGEPVPTHRKPLAGTTPMIGPATSDEFSEARLGLQWQWNSNWREDWFALDAHPGFLRLFAQPHPKAAAHLPSSTAILSQKLPAAAFTVETRIQLQAGSEGDQGGLILHGYGYAWLGLRKTGHSQQLVLARCEAVTLNCKETSETLVPVSVAQQQSLVLRMRMEAGGVARFFYSLDGVEFQGIGAAFFASRGRWVGARMGLFSGGAAGSHVDVDYFRVVP